VRSRRRDRRSVVVVRWSLDRCLQYGQPHARWSRTVLARRPISGGSEQPTNASGGIGMGRISPTKLQSPFRSLRFGMLASSAVLALGCGVADRPPPHTNPAVLPTPTGRVADPLQCPDQRPPTRDAAACEPQTLGEEGNGVRLTRPNGPTPTPLGLPGRSEQNRCGHESIVLCGFFAAGPPGSYALSCRDATGSLTGGVRFVAPDGSVLTEGTCDRGRAIGAWLWWSDGRLVRAAAMVDRVSVGLEVIWKDGGYHALPHSPSVRGPE